MTRFRLEKEKGVRDPNPRPKTEKQDALTSKQPRKIPCAVS